MTTPPDLETLVARFQAYAGGFRTGEPDQDYHFQLKVEHTLRVLDLARRIAAEERMAPDLARLVALAALFHDAGRFLQYARYRTFSDRHSANHARLGITALLRHNLLEGLDRDTRRVVLGAVFLHNVRSLAPNLRQPLDAVTRAVRDADKLDIYPVMIAHMDGSKPLDPVVSLGVVRDPRRYSEALVAELEHRRLASYENMRYQNDFRLLTAGWIYDLNYATSRRILAQKGYLERMFQDLPQDERLAALRRQILGDLGAA